MSLFIIIWSKNIIDLNRIFDTKLLISQISSRDKYPDIFDTTQNKTGRVFQETFYTFKGNVTDVIFRDMNMIKIIRLKGDTVA